MIENLSDARQDGLPDDALHGRGAVPRRRVAIIVGGKIVAEGSPVRAGDRRSERTIDEFTLRARRRRAPDLAGIGEPAMTTAECRVALDRRGDATLNQLTGWALEQRRRADGLTGRPADARGHLPGHHREGERRSRHERRRAQRSDR